MSEDSLEQPSPYKIVDTITTGDTMTPEELPDTAYYGYLRGWNDAIEAAAEWHDEQARKCQEEARQCEGMENMEQWCLRLAAAHREAATAIRKLRKG